MFSEKISLKSVLVVAIIAGAAATLASCDRKKEDSKVITEEATSYAEEQLALEQIYDNADRLVLRAVTLGAASLGNCVVITVDSSDNSDLQLMTIHFGNECLAYDGRYRSGRLKVYMSKPKVAKWGEPGYYQKVTFDRYEYEGYKVAGYRETYKVSVNALGNTEFSIYSVDTLGLPKSSGTVTGISNRVREWYSGQSTIQLNDDVYRFTGSGTFISKNKDKYSVEIVKPLVDALDCNWINEGVINIFPENATQRVVDFGNGQCENEVSVSVNGVVRVTKVP